MTNIASMILNDLPISKELREKIDFIKNSKMTFKDFNNFRLLINSLENFEPNPKLSKEMYKNQINEKIAFVLEKLENYIQIINEDVKNKEIIQNSDNQTQELEKQNENEDLNEMQIFLNLIMEIEKLSQAENFSKESIEVLLEKTNKLLLNAKDLDKNELDILKETKNYLIDVSLSFENNSQLQESNSLQENKEDSENLKDLPLSTEIKEVLNKDIEDKNEAEQSTQNSLEEFKKTLPELENFLVNFIDEKTKDMLNSNQFSFDENTNILIFNNKRYKIPIDENGNYNKSGFIAKASMENDYFMVSQTLERGTLKIIDLNLKELEDAGININEILAQKNKNLKVLENTKPLQVQDSLFSEEELNTQNYKKRK